MTEFLNMGGYGAFIWPSYAVSVVVLAVLVIRTRRHLVRLNAELSVLEASRPRPRRRRTASDEARSS